MKNGPKSHLPYSRRCASQRLTVGKGSIVTQRRMNSSSLGTRLGGVADLLHQIHVLVLESVAHVSDRLGGLRRWRGARGEYPNPVVASAPFRGSASMPQRLTGSPSPALAYGNSPHTCRSPKWRATPTTQTSDRCAVLAQHGPGLLRHSVLSRSPTTYRNRMEVQICGPT
jgi:hypothetical protein